MAKSKKGPIPVPSAVQAAIAAGIARMAEMKNRSSQDSSSVYTDRLKEGETATGFNDPEYIKKNYAGKVQPKYEKAKTTREKYIQSGLAVEKNGDFFLTPKYYELNKQAKVDSYLKEFERRQDIDEKFVNEQAGKTIYEKNKIRGGSAAESMKNYK